MIFKIPDILVEKVQENLSDVKGPFFGSRAPGRIEILGNHTDYNGGLVLASTIDQYVWMIGSASIEAMFYSVQFNNKDRFDPNNPILLDEPSWRNYVRGVYWAFKRRNHDAKGVTGAIYGDIPVGGGLSSSAALEVASVNLIASSSGLKIHPKSKAMLAFESERLFCGISCGVMDQFTSQLGMPNSLLGIHCGNLVTQNVAMPSGVSFVVVNSMISRDAGSVLNERKGECLQALQILQEIGWDISALSAISIADLANVTESLDEKLSRRVRHIVKENQRVRDGIALLQQNHIEEFGKLMIESHESSRDLYEVSHPNLEILMDISQGCEGMFGCRLTGAGSGGNLLLLTKTNDAERIIRETTTEYEKETGLLAESTLCAVPGGVVVEELPEF